MLNSGLICQLSLLMGKTIFIYQIVVDILYIGIPKMT